MTKRDNHLPEDNDDCVTEEEDSDPILLAKRPK